MGRPPLPSSEQIAALPVTFRGTVRPEWIDVMGHMNVAWYTHVFSHATGGLLELLGTTHADFASGKVGTAALEVHVNYLGELHRGAAFQVHTRLLGAGDKRFHLLHFLMEASRPAALSEAVGTYFDLAARRAAPMPSASAERAARLLREHAALPWPAPVTGVMGVGPNAAR